MGKLAKFTANTEHLKLAIMDYKYFNIEIVKFSPEYFNKHRHLFKRKRDPGDIDKTQFHNRLYEFLWSQKISELLAIVFLLDKEGKHLSMSRLNNLLGRNPSQYQATREPLKRMCRLDILRWVKGPNNSDLIFINKDVTWIYGDDEFREALLEEWDGESKEYMRMKLKGLIKKKEAFEERIGNVKINEAA